MSRRWRLWIKFLWLPLAVPAALIMRLLRPLIVVRASELYSSRIGHFAVNTELYLCERDAALNRPYRRGVDVFAFRDDVANEQLAVMWKRVLPVDESGFVAALASVNRRLPGSAAHAVPFGTHGRDIHNLFDRFPPHLTFLPEEEAAGERRLREMGIPAGAPLVFLIVRDSAYLQERFPGDDWSYHDYRDSRIGDYALAAERLAAEGFYVVRMGGIVKEALKASHPNVIDYATNGMRTPFMDVYLGAKCAFAISTGTGLDEIPHVFRRPICYVNYGPLEYLSTYVNPSITIVKGHRLGAEGRLLTFREILGSGAGRYLFASDYRRYGIELVDNTPEEIADAAMEMTRRISGTWTPAEDDEALQQRFWQIFRENGDPALRLHGEVRGRMGATFLRKYRALLD